MALNFKEKEEDELDAAYVSPRKPEEDCFP